MGAKTWMLVYTSGSVPEALKAQPVLDREASLALASKLFPKRALAPLEDGTVTFACPPDDEIMVACYPGVSIVAASEFGIDYPSRLPRRFIDAGAGGTVYLHAMHSVVDWFAFAVWERGVLRRALSLSPDSGIMEDIGEKFAFERPYWAGENPAMDDGAEYPVPFHPLNLGETVLANFFGYQIEGEINPELVDPESLPMMRLKRAKPWWQFW